MRHRRPDPAIHGASPRVERVSMDHWVKPGGDEKTSASTGRISSAVRMSVGAVLWRKPHKPRGPKGRGTCELAL
jgi:hypothetical protein